MSISLDGPVPFLDLKRPQVPLTHERGTIAFMSASLSCSIVVIGGSPHSIGGGHIAKRGRDPYCIACERDLEGIVAKSARGRCQSDGRSTSWLKIKNEDYSRDGAALNGRRLYWGGNSQTVPLLNSPALGQKKEFKCSLKLR